VWDQGTRSFLCSHRADVLKIWVVLQRYGADGIGSLYDHLCDVARAMYDAILTRADFVAMHEPECNILCFRYVGNGRVGDEERLDALNLRMREEYNRSGEGWITTTQLAGRRVLRVTIMNSRTTADDVREVLDGLARVGARLTEPNE
jgi:L-2,4-diaminobutyrate decarboxylase